MIFSVGPRRGQKSVTREGFSNVCQSEIAHYGECRLFIEADDFFGGHNSKSYLSKVLKNPTWKQVLACAKTAQKRTGDYHHDFLEGLYEVESLTKKHGVTVLRFALGS